MSRFVAIKNNYLAFKLTNLTSFVLSNQYLLQQIHQQLIVLKEDSKHVYNAPIPIIGGASIGAHLRHILDFYSAFHFGQKKGHIDYDKRARNLEVENKLDQGISHLDCVIEQLQSIANSSNQTVTINASVDVNGNQPFGQSNLIRELQSLHSHTTHHMAIIAIVLKLNNIELDENFGKAPSTIQYEQEQNASFCSKFGIATQEA